MNHSSDLLVLSPPRRRFLLAAGAGALAAFGAGLPFSTTAGVIEQRLTARRARVRLVPEPHPETDVWSYNDSAPGPEIRVRQGDRLRVVVENRLDEGTTVHWHGIRLPNAMDGVPHITQPPIDPGGTFVYEFTLPDAGTYWYHPHQRSYEQSGRGMHGALIVEERTPVRVDRDVVWVLGDWRLDRDASIRGGFGSFMDVSHNGRVGNTVTINGRVPDRFPVRAGERIRLRLINAANARIFGLEFGAHRPQVIALDGQPVEPHEPPDGIVVLGPAMRADVILDALGRPGSRHPIHDRFYRRLEYRLVDIAYSDEPPLRSAQPDWPLKPPANPLAEPDLERAERKEVVFTGGMMGNMRAMSRGMAWAVNDVSASCGEARGFDPLFWLKRGRSYVLRLVNETAWHHPIHLHGHSFRVISRSGKPTRHREWLDTVLMFPRETIEIALVAETPGDWMFHCHVLEHQAAGMMACLRIT
ncbi:MAG: multicopper oxidase family protein [Betaproteobacteria bacterium]